MKQKLILLFAALCCCTANALAQHNGGTDVDIEQIRKLQYAQLAISNLYVDSVVRSSMVRSSSIVSRSLAETIPISLRFSRI